jgi:hypothetical protein
MNRRRFLARFPYPSATMASTDMTCKNMLAYPIALASRQRPDAKRLFAVYDSDFACDLGHTINEGRECECG